MEIRNHNKLENMSHNFEQLQRHILSLSRASDFEAARKEWHLTGIELHEEMTNCPCGQDIIEKCLIENTVTGERTHVGNVCINRFIGISTGSAFDGLKRIAEDPLANANEDLIFHAYKLGYIYEKEFDFLMDTRRKRVLSQKQLQWKEKINRRILHRTVVRVPKKQ
jgi:hypothetical protein